MNVLIVCHAGTSLGLGHLTRSIVVARALHDELGVNVQLLIQGEPVQRPDLNHYCHKFIELGENLLDAVGERAIQINAQLVVLDLHPNLVPENIERLLIALRKAKCKVVAVDGLVNQRDNLDLIFIPSFCFSPLKAMVNATPILFGWDCFLLNVKCLPVDWISGRQVLVLTGGSDATGLGNSLPERLNESLPVDAELHWVTGPYAKQPEWPVIPRLAMVNHQSPSSLDDLMVASHYAITVYGVSFFELLYYGIPTVVFSPYGNKDDVELAAIAEAGIALVAKDEYDAVNKLKKLMADDVLAASLSQCARKRLSVSGGHKFVQALSGLID
jgi:spore coat polysaccharide biosynthesis predicted glycosyltransferase SpsG